LRGSAAAAVLLLAAACSYFVVLTRAAVQMQPPQPAAARSGASCMPHEMDALLAFKKRGVTGDPAGVLASWRRRQGGVHGMDDGCCRWRGVRCSDGTDGHGHGHVVEIRLRNANLYDGHALVGKISRSLLSLEHLEYLDLSMNSLEGSTGRVPEFLGSFKNLKYLNLSGIPFSGRVPPHLGNLSNLQYLDISSSQDTFSLDISWLIRLRHLQYLNLERVNLSATANWPHVVNMIPSLKFLDLSDSLLASSNQSLPCLNLTSLEWLDLSENYFNHPIASCWFWNLTSLRYINLPYTGLYGQLPEALGTMISLQYLDLSYTTISASPMINLNNLCNLRILRIEACFSYVNITELIERLPQCSSRNKLQELNLQSNQVIGVLPDSLQHFTSLVILDLSHNNITGHVPTFLGKFHSLNSLDLSSNNFTGGVPDEIGALTNLTVLNLRNNRLLDSVITEKHFGGLESLQYIDLSYTSLKVELSSEWQPPFRLRNAQFASCQLGPLFPAWLRLMVDIFFLDISDTGINDSIPHWFSNTFSNSGFLNLANNQITGVLPRNMEIMSLLERLYLSSNNLTGPISRLPPNLTQLDISMNSLLGPLPKDFGAPKLTELSLFSNRLTGSIPKYICNCKGLTTLDLANNLFDGEIPPCSGMTVLTTLELSNNSLSGDFPIFVRNSPNLQFLDLAWNKFSGRLPTWIGDLVGLQFLRLSHNMFSGNIPVSITSLRCLQYLDIANNSMSSSLPRNMLNLTAMRGKYSTIKYPQQQSYCGSYSVPGEYHSVDLSGVTKGQELNYGTSSHILYMKMMSIDLSLNNLSGEIPEEIIILDALVNLNLSHNHFSRNVPYNIGAMRSLESLDLSRNDLSGEIPTSLSNLAFLSYLDLSYNNLTGKIPSGSQLDSLYASNPTMYAGNIDLCGPPPMKACSRNETSIHSYMRRNEAGEGFFYIGLGCGFTVGIWMVLCALLFKKQWRVAYFHLLDKLYSKYIRHT
jgi:Leucine-rich repeat (LRR) protein